MSQFARRVSALKDFTTAQETANAILALPNLKGEDREAVELALAEHKHNPQRAVRTASAAGSVSKPVQSAAPGLTREEILQRLTLPEGDDQRLTVDQASALLASLSPQSNGRTGGPARPYLLKNGSTASKNPHPKFLLLRDVTSAGKARKAPTVMLFVLPGKEVKGKGYSGNVMLTVPVLRALVQQHGCGGLLDEALTAYDDGTIALAREKDEDE